MTDEKSTPAAAGPWWKSRLPWLALACLAFIALFAHFASEVLERETSAFDAAVRRWATAHRTPVVLTVFSIITRLGEWYSLVVGALIVAWVLIRRGARKRPLLVAAAPFLMSLIIYLLKVRFQVPRPDITAALTFSFPSGHTSESTAVAIVIGFVLNREQVAPRLGWAIAVVVPLLVGASRVMLDMHWGSDVIGGWLIGSAYAAGTCALYEHARRLSLNREA